MYSLERTFYGVAAFTACLAFLLFSMFFDVGDMIAAAFRGPGAFAEWNMAKKIREARRFGIPAEILPDQSTRPIGWSNSSGDLSKLQGRARLFAGPRFPMEGRLKTARMSLAQQGFTHEGFLEMEAYYQVDRAYNAGVVGIERLLVRNNHSEALDRLDELLIQVDAKNRRAVAELLLLRLRIVVELRASPSEIYDLFMQRLVALKEIATLEAAGYQGIPRYEKFHQRAVDQIAALEGQIDRLRSNRGKALTAFASGIAFGEFPPELAARMQEGIRRQASVNGASQEQTQRALDWVQTRIHHPASE